jgi:formyltetrahydrofolate deformylase
MTQEFTLTVTCRARSGIVAAVTTNLFNAGCYLSELHQFDDELSGRFFLRAVGRVTTGQNSIEDVAAGFADLAGRMEMTWALHRNDDALPTVIMVSKMDHCLSDLLYRVRKGELKIRIVAVISNHRDCQSDVERAGYRFVYLPVNKENKKSQDQAVQAILQETGAELVVLARYMQILSDELCQSLSGKAINIHHSFLPGFKGARPYHQAHERGVKLIGATAHYVTPDLDEGPIIEQAVQPVDHSYTPEMLAMVGRDTETMALARAVRLHAEHRVFLYDNKTVVFR